MSAWSVTMPQDTDLAVTIPEAIRNARIDIGERLRAYNGVFEEHSFKGEGATGRHAISQVGWAAEWASVVELQEAAEAGDIPAGSLHYVPDEGIYVVYNYNIFILSILTHDDLSNLDSNDGSGGHTQYLRLDGSVDVSGNLYANLTGDAELPDDDSIPLSASHVVWEIAALGLSGDWGWEQAHGAQCIKGRHIQDDIFSVHRSIAKNYTIVSTGFAVGSPYSYYNFRANLAQTSLYNLFPFSMRLSSGGNVAPGSHIELHTVSSGLQLRVNTYSPDTSFTVQFDSRSLT